MEPWHSCGGKPCLEATAEHSSTFSCRLQATCCWRAAPKLRTAGFPVRWLDSLSAVPSDFPIGPAVPCCFNATTNQQHVPGDAGYAWQCAYCACGTHLGWHFTAVRPSLQPASFWGLRRPALQAGDNRDPTPPAGTYLHSAGSSENGDGGWTSAEEDEEAEPRGHGGSPVTASDANATSAEEA